MGGGDLGTGGGLVTLSVRGRGLARLRRLLATADAIAVWLGRSAKLSLGDCCLAFISAA